MTFNNVEQIKEYFVKDGWSDDISFDELSLEEAKNNGYLFAINGIHNGEKFFKMKVSEDIYNHKGKVVMYNF